MLGLAWRCFASRSVKFAGTPLLFNWAEGGRTPPLTHRQIADLGYRIIIFPLSAMLSATRAMQAALAAIKDAGTPIPLLDGLPRFDDFLGFIGLPEVYELEQRFGG